MGRWIAVNRWFLVWGGIFAILALLGLLSSQPPTHEVRTPNATDVTEVRVVSDDQTYFTGAPPPPSASLDDVRCSVWRARNNRPCPDPATVGQTIWPGLAQASKTLYVPMVDPCVNFNVEFTASTRTLVIHCTTSRAWLYIEPRPFPGVQALPPAVVFVIPTNAIPPGNLTIVRDDRVEHWLGDDSTEPVLGTVTIV